MWKDAFSASLCAQVLRPAYGVDEVCGSMWNRSQQFDRLLCVGKPDALLQGVLLAWQEIFTGHILFRSGGVGLLGYTLCIRKYLL